MPLWDQDTKGNQDFHRDEPRHVHDDHGLRSKLHGAQPRWIAAALLGLGLLVAIPIAMNENGRAGWNGANAGEVMRAPIALNGRVWVPEGQTALLPDRHMRVVANTTEGQDLYMLMAPQGGGGGVAVPGATGRYYLRVGDDAYQPVMLRDLKADWRARPVEKP